MARFMGIVQGARGEASRVGGASSGIRAQAQSWNVGVKVYGRATDGYRDVFELYMTGGSNNPSGTFLGTVTLDAEGQPTFELAACGVTRDGIPSDDETTCLYCDAVVTPEAGGDLCAEHLAEYRATRVSEALSR